MQCKENVLPCYLSIVNLVKHRPHVWLEVFSPQPGAGLVACSRCWPGAVLTCPSPRRDLGARRAAAPGHWDHIPQMLQDSAIQFWHTGCPKKRPFFEWLIKNVHVWCFWKWRIFFSACRTYELMIDWLRKFNWKLAFILFDFIHPDF